MTDHYNISQSLLGSCGHSTRQLRHFLYSLDIVASRSSSNLSSIVDTIMQREHRSQTKSMSALGVRSSKRSNCSTNLRPPRLRNNSHPIKIRRIPRPTSPTKSTNLNSIRPRRRKATQSHQVILQNILIPIIS